MFTGIIEAIGTIEQLRPIDGDLRIQVNTGKLDLADVKIGDSIAVSGVCLTVVALHGQSFEADVSGETLSCSTFKKLARSQKVNLEKALTLTTRLGGHLVSGHVDGVGEIIEKRPAARSYFYKVRVPSELAKYIASKGSVTVDGTSLTINSVNGCEFELNIIPQTLTETIFSEYSVGTFINIEVDLLARYLERLLLAMQQPAETGSQKQQAITESFLTEHGFMSR